MRNTFFYLEICLVFQGQKEALSQIRRKKNFFFPSLIKQRFKILEDDIVTINLVSNVCQTIRNIYRKIFLTNSFVTRKSLHSIFN